jgi:hypothetical protein
MLIAFSPTCHYSRCYLGKRSRVRCCRTLLSSLEGCHGPIWLVEHCNPRSEESCTRVSVYFTSTHTPVTNTGSYLIIKRRIAWLLGRWMMEGTMAPQETLVWDILIYLLSDSNVQGSEVVRLTASTAIQQSVDVCRFELSLPTALHSFRPSTSQRMRSQRIFRPFLLNSFS